MATRNFRYNTSTGKDTTKHLQALDYKPQLAINPVQEECTFFVQVEGNIDVSVSTCLDYCYPGDKLTIVFSTSGQNWAINLSNGFHQRNSFVLNANDKCAMSFVFDGWVWLKD